MGGDLPTKEAGRAVAEEPGRMPGSDAVGILGDRALSASRVASEPENKFLISDMQIAGFFTGEESARCLGKRKIEGCECLFHFGRQNQKYSTRFSCFPSQCYAASMYAKDAFSLSKE